MDTTDLLNRWSTLSLDDIQAELDAGQNIMAAEQLYGAEEVAAMRASEETRSFGGQREAVVLLPGLMGSLLASVRGVITPLWLNPALILKGQSSYLELNQDGTADRSPNILTVATGSDTVPGQVTIRATSAEAGDNVSELDALVEGEPLEIAFNVRYLIEAVSVIDTPQAVLETTRPDRPGLFRPVGAGPEEFVHVIMPMQFNR